MCKPVRKREWIDKSGLTMVMDEGVEEFNDAEDPGSPMAYVSVSSPGRVNSW